MSNFNLVLAETSDVLKTKDKKNISKYIIVMCEQKKWIFMIDKSSELTDLQSVLNSAFVF